MEIKNYLTELENAQRNQDPNGVIAAIQKFYTSIAAIKITDEDYEPKTIGLYMTLKQLEKNGLDTSVIKTAIYARVLSGSQQHKASWANVVNSLNPFFVLDGFEPIKI